MSETQQTNPTAPEPEETIAAGDLFHYGELFGKVIAAYLQFKTLPSGQEADSPPIHYHGDVITIHVKKG